MKGSVARALVSLALSVLLVPAAVTCQDRESKLPPADKDKQAAKEAKGTAPETENPGVVVLSGVAKTARIAGPNERVVLNGRVMRMADYVAAVSSSTEALQRLRTQEKHNPEKDPPVPPSRPTS